MNSMNCITSNQNLNIGTYVFLSCRNRNCRPTRGCGRSWRVTNRVFSWSPHRKGSSVSSRATTLSWWSRRWSSTTPNVTVNWSRSGGLLDSKGYGIGTQTGQHIILIHICMSDCREDSLFNNRISVAECKTISLLWKPSRKSHTVLNWF